MSDRDRKVYGAFVPGTPRPQGSMQAIVSKSTGRAFMKSSNTTVQWRNSVVETFGRWLEDGVLEAYPDGPVVVTLTFFFDRPKSHPKKRIASDRGVKYNGSDVDKLARAMLDALTVAGVIGDDTQVCELHAQKSYGDAVDPPSPEGVLVAIRRKRGGYPPAGGWS